MEDQIVDLSRKVKLFVRGSAGKSKSYAVPLKQDEVKWQLGIQGEAKGKPVYLSRNYFGVTDDILLSDRPIKKRDLFLCYEINLDYDIQNYFRLDKRQSQDPMWESVECDWIEALVLSQQLKKAKTEIKEHGQEDLERLILAILAGGRLDHLVINESNFRIFTNWQKMSRDEFIKWCQNVIKVDDESENSSDDEESFYHLLSMSYQDSVNSVQATCGLMSAQLTVIKEIYAKLHGDFGIHHPKIEDYE